MSAIYLHIPFCKRLCGYCDFFKSVKLQHLKPVVEAMERELVEQREFLSDKRVETIYFGGGTPSLLSAQQIKHFLDVVAANYSAEGLEEVTLEVNPDDLSMEYLEEVRRAGVNRLSIGVQSFDDEELLFMNRRHNAAQAEESVKMAQRAGFDNITIDLIFGVKGFGEDILRRSIAVALSLGVQHISAYHLTIEHGTAFARKVERGALSVVSDEVSQAEYDLLDRELSAAGFEHYEVSNYALSAYRSKHNSSYWHGVHYLGVGPAAHSFNGDVRRFAVESIEGYLDGGAGRYNEEVLTQVDRYNEYIMTSLRCSSGIDLNEIESKFSQELYKFAVEGVKCWLKDGKLRADEAKIYIPTKHFLISDMIIESLFYCKS